LSSCPRNTAQAPRGDSGRALVYQDREMTPRASQSYWYFSFPTPLADGGFGAA
jgi:hypothetical protein